MAKIILFCLTCCLILMFIPYAQTESQNLLIIMIDCAENETFKDEGSVNAKISIIDNGNIMTLAAKVQPYTMTNDIIEKTLPQASLRIDSDEIQFILYNGGNDAVNTRIINAVCHDYIDLCSLEIPVRSVETAEVYLNGEYYGLYTACETIENAIMRIEGLSESNLLHICRADGSNIHGNASNFNDALQITNSLDLSDKDDLRILDDLLDMDSILNCLAINSFFGNTNFYGSLFFYQVENGPWKCAISDFAYAFYFARDNTIGRLVAKNDRHTPYDNVVSVVDKILKTPDYREMFLSKLRAIYEKLPVHLMQETVDMEYEQIVSLLPKHYALWAIKYSTEMNKENEYPVTSPEEALLYQEYRIYRLKEKTLITRPYYFMSSVLHELELSDEEILSYFGEVVPELPEVPGDTWEDYKRGRIAE